MPDHEILTIEEVAEYLRVSERTVYDWANKGSLPCGKLGTTWRFKRCEIERWVDERLSGKQAHGTAPSIVVGDVLTPERVTFIHTAHKKEALDCLIGCLSEAPQVMNVNELANEIFHREELMSTGIGFSVAVPHVRLDSVTGLVMAVGICKQDIVDYASLDETPIRIICMVAARTNQHAQYLKTLGAVSSLLKTASVREALVNAPDEATAYTLLASNGVRPATQPASGKA